MSQDMTDYYKDSRFRVCSQAGLKKQYDPKKIYSNYRSYFIDRSNKQNLY
ncbi:hypothetical protein GCM10010976_07710 [Bizionia arctica]|uniref:Uncharacterized protein n=1 Tax=Bizionia arctica TaxID=1495645 RepID=A0A917GCK7_9FLAO|nr:hypothetical protein GCM10010976_07710 [Bizionia arctica]